MRTAALALPFLVVFSACSATEERNDRAIDPPDEDFMVAIRAWRPRLKGHVQPEEFPGRDPEGEIETRSFSVHRHAALTGAATALEFDAHFVAPGEKSGGPRVRWVTGRWSGQGALSHDVDLGGSILPAGSSVDSRFDLNVYLVGGRTHQFKSPNFEFGGTAGFGLARTRLRSDTSAGSISDRAGAGFLWLESDTVFRPASWLFIRAHVGLILAGFVEAGAQAGFGVGALEAEAGYRGAWLSSEGEGDFEHISFSGISFSLALRF